MATVKKSKKRIIVPIAIVLVIAIIVTSIVIVRKVNGGEQVTLHTISTGDIYETVSATGDVTAGASRTYKVGTVATVKEVFVQKGDKVKEGDKLATFDTSNGTPRSPNCRGLIRTLRRRTTPLAAIRLPLSRIWQQSISRSTRWKSRLPSCKSVPTPLPQRRRPQPKSTAPRCRPQFPQRG